MRTVLMLKTFFLDRVVLLGTTHYNTISGSVNSKTQDIVFFVKKTANRKQNVVKTVPMAVSCTLLFFQVFFPGLVVKTTKFKEQTRMDTGVWFPILLNF